MNSSDQNRHFEAPLALIPLSMINQYAFCKRRFFIMHVLGDMRENAHVQEGRFVHEAAHDGRRVIERPDGTIQTRAVHVVSERLGLAGVVDVVEEKEGEIYPVEFKKGDLGEWQNDRLQVAAQAMALEEMRGITIRRGCVFYFGSRRRDEFEIDDALRAAAHSAAIDMRLIAGQDEMPGTEFGPKCGGCSVRRVCMPEETDFALGKAAKPPSRPVPGMGIERVLYVEQPETCIHLEGERLIVRKENAVLVDLPAFQVDGLVLCGAARLSHHALRFVIESRKHVTYLSRSGRFISRLEPDGSRNVPLRLRQFDAHRDARKTLALGKRIVEGKLRNMRALLQRYGRQDGKEAAATATVAIEKALGLLGSVATMDELRGVEGLGSRDYLVGFGACIREDSGLVFEHRNRRPPRDEVNALMSFAYTMLYNDLHAACQIVGLDPYIGYLHAERYGRASLALDLMEEFRPIVADSVVLTMINNRMIEKREFERDEVAVMLGESGRRRFYEVYEKRKSTEATHPVFGYKLSYRRLFELQARVMAKAIDGEIEEYIPFMVR